jgi:type 1 glutamine amidotransferase
VEAFCETDEHYRLEILSNDIDILAASYSPPQGETALYQENPYHNSPAWLCPAALVRTQGKGRVCVLTPGHHPAVWQNPRFQRLLENALRWCAGR